MAELRPTGTGARNQKASVRVGRCAGRQRGVISWGQLVRCGLGKATIGRWVAAGRLHRVHPGVYAVGHRALSTEGGLMAALLYAGPGAALSHMTAAWWWGLLRDLPAQLHLSVAGRRRSLPRVRVHNSRSADRVFHRGLPVATVPRTLLDIAPHVPFATLRRTLAEAEYQRVLDLDAVAATLGRGHRGSAALRRALTQHSPRLAQTLSVLEERFLALCEHSGIPLPEVNPKVAGLMVDALWRRQRVIVELDGHVAHAGAPAIERDRGRDLKLRAAGFVVLRYTWQQVTREPQAVVADLRAAL
ncbi:MAG: type IV toxin-antitoxin system AbiEi family antitoxin domain-containing protein [Actinomycetota bacterium]